jgi:hypothetical protein
MADLKASAQSAKHAVHMLAEEKKEEEATTQKKADESGIVFRLLGLPDLCRLRRRSNQPT